MIGFKPCGACASYVSDVTGCRHWRPAVAAVIRRTLRERQRANEEAARRRAKADVAAFNKSMQRKR